MHRVSYIGGDPPPFPCRNFIHGVRKESGNISVLYVGPGVFDTDCSGNTSDTICESCLFKDNVVSCVGPTIIHRALCVLGHNYS